MRSVSKDCPRCSWPILRDAAKEAAPQDEGGAGLAETAGSRVGRVEPLSEIRGSLLRRSRISLRFIHATGLLIEAEAARLENHQIS